MDGGVRMKCQKCQFENREDAKFCNQCGNRLELACRQCGNVNPLGSMFCSACGRELRETSESAKVIPETERERKHVTVLFSDLSGYTAITEKLDPEEVKEIMSRVFGEIAQIVIRYEGFVERFFGDEVLVLFGAPRAHEDDPVRAIRAAREILHFIEDTSPQIEAKVGQPLSMHIGINSGLVIIGDEYIDKARHGLTGDAINVAARLTKLAGPGEILVGPDTYSRTAGYFTFEHGDPIEVKGKSEPIKICKVLSPKEEPRKIHGLHGVKADLIGRKVEMAQLQEAIENLRQGEGAIFAIYGDAGTGKSRLIEEFKATLDLQKMQWREGHSYAYAQGISYFPLIDLLNRTLQIEEGDPPEQIKKKVESRIEALLGKKEGVVPYIGSLLSLSYPEAERMSPDSWKYHVQKSIQTVLAALVQRAPTIICLEDLHWADPSSLELLRFVLSESRFAALFLCTYRPPFNLFPSHDLTAMGQSIREIQIHDLSPSEAQDMAESLLKTKSIPSEFRRFMQEKVEGNPFYLEELVNSLIETATLVRDNGGWRLARSIRDTDISPTIHGVILARLDRLEKETKLILQEASVIGRNFLYEILKRITELKDQIDGCLTGLERLDLIRTKSLEPDLEYMFKHALTQEAVYSGLLKTEREKVHERIALVMEQLFADRLPEFYETLAFHFTQARSIHRAVDYLMKSGEKNLGRYALEEADQYFKQAFGLLNEKPDKTKVEQVILLDLLIKWGFVFHWRGAYGGLVDLLNPFEDWIASFDDKEKRGMFYALLGLALHSRHKLEDGYQYLQKALKLGEEIGNHRLIGYACAWLAFNCAQLGLLDDAIVLGKRSFEMAKHIKSDHILFISSIRAMGYSHYYRGESKKAGEIGRLFLDYGHRESDIRSTALGYTYLGISHQVAGSFEKSIDYFQRSIQTSVDPIFSYTTKIALAVTYIHDGQMDNARKLLEEILRYSADYGSEHLGTGALGLLGMSLISKGDLSRGVRAIEDGMRESQQNNSRWYVAIANAMMGNIYLETIRKTKPKSISFLAKNMGFLMRTMPLASKKAENHFRESIAVAKKIGAKHVWGMSALGLGLLYQKKRRPEEAREYLSRAVALFEECEAGTYLKRAKETLASLG